jgi:hypothetical protein
MPNKLDQLCTNVRRCIECFDKVMLSPSTATRGRQFAQIMNALQLELDLFERYYKADFKKVKKAKKVTP